MKIGIDIRALVAGRNSGVETYTVQFLTELFQRCSSDEFVLFFNAYHNTGIDLSWTAPYKNVRIRRTRIPNKLLNFMLLYARWPKIDRLMGGVDVVFMPNITFCALSRSVRLILTMHDLSFEHYPTTFSWKRRLWHFFVHPRALARRADHIIAVSDATRDDLVQTYNIAPTKITTIHSGLNACYRQYSRNDLSLLTVKERYHVPYRFILFLGTIEPRKNIIGLIDAYNMLRARYGKEYANVGLVIAGNPGWKSRQIYKAITLSPYRNDIHVIGFVAEDDKVALYNLATVFVYPSFFEGFGFPPLEAMACGTPTITSNTSSLPEVVADGALMIDPDRPEEIVYALHSILSDTSLANRLSDHGIARTMTFSWQHAAQTFCNVLHSS